MHRHHETSKEHLNVSLVSRQNLTDEDQDKIVELHKELHAVFDEMEAENDIPRLRNLAIIVKQLEFDLQEAWGFEKDENNHTWWFQVPHCTCPILDNFDATGTPYRVITTDCIIHGGEHE